MSHDESDDSDYSHYSSSMQQVYLRVYLATLLTINLEAGLRGAKTAGRRVLRSHRRRSLWMRVTRRRRRSGGEGGPRAPKTSKSSKLPCLTATSTSSIFISYLWIYLKPSPSKRSIPRSIDWKIGISDCWQSKNKSFRANNLSKGAGAGRKGSKINLNFTIRSPKANKRSKFSHFPSANPLKV